MTSKTDTKQVSLHFLFWSPFFQISIWKISTNFFLCNLKIIVHVYQFNKIKGVLITLHVNITKTYWLSFTLCRERHVFIKIPCYNFQIDINSAIISLIIWTFCWEYLRLYIKKRAAVFRLLIMHWWMKNQKSLFSCCWSLCFITCLLWLWKITL